jgi:tetratricopeptide (TPR) repeat protein
MALLEALASDPRNSRDRVALVSALLRVSDLEPAGPRRAPSLERARSLFESLPADARQTAYAYGVEQVLWQSLATQEISAKNYAAARDFYDRQREAAEASLRLDPRSLDVSRNLSLAYKQLGATLEMTGARPRALALYQQALDLDQQRVTADPHTRTWRLDLSFAHAAIGSALQAQGDLPTARARYETAVALREGVVADDPSDDFAVLSLARGYWRLSLVCSRQLDAAAALDYGRRHLRIYSDRLAAHPERENLWKEYADAALDQVELSTEMLAKPAIGPARRQHAAAVRAILDEIAAANERWIGAKHAGALVDAATLRKHRTALDALLSTH